ncbi:hypothetical protein GCM10007906_35450 [Vibrio hyugaensis]|uniref:HNH endonuclease n=1 Tax=Vibrio hyugaensis TaxID=1534743 RepID=A0ABQ5Y8I8_9VIBR|nr:hypothetical protein [Vibrio hyugaensis]GLR05957.1 hypothetical protein GCM10007906_35450 [Vibrio hyugaensis]
MIYLNANYAEDLVNRYEGVCKQYMRDRINRIVEDAPEEYRDLLECFFGESGLSILIKGDVQCLQLAFQEIFEELPILSERYNRKVFFQNFAFTFDPTDYNIRRNVDKDRIVLLKDIVIECIDEFNSTRRSLLLESYREQLANTVTPRDLRDLFKKLTTLTSGSSKLSDAQIDCFPNWVNDLDSAFNYDYLIQSFGREIVQSLEISFCPYCAEEVIEPFDRYRPAIDHFYPKSKYPFLSLSLYNFVPAGTRCNSDFKKTNEMLGYYHPHEEPFPQEQLFEFSYPVDRRISREDVEVLVKSVGCGADLSVSLFELEASYNKFICKQQFIDLIERYQYQESLGQQNLEQCLNSTENLRRLLNLNLSDSQKRVQYQKFLVDALNQIGGLNYVVNNR